MLERVDMGDTSVQDGLKKLEQFKWIRMLDDAKLTVTREFEEIFTESCEDCYVNEPEATLALTKVVRIMHQPAMAEGLLRMLDEGMPKDRIVEHLHSAMVALKMLEKIGGLGDPSPNVFIALCIVLMAWTESVTKLTPNL